MWRELSRIQRHIRAMITPYQPYIYLLICSYNQIYTGYYLFSFHLQTNTFQAIVITDGMQSYSLFTYTSNCDSTYGINWAGYGVNAGVGYNLGGDYYMNHPLSGSESVADIDEGGNCTGTGWNNVWYQLTYSLDEIQEMKAACFNMYFSDLNNVGDISTYRSVGDLQPCPCTLWQAIFDGRFELDDLYPNCFYQLFPASSGAAQYCCYSHE